MKTMELIHTISNNPEIKSVLIISDKFDEIERTPMAAINVLSYQCDHLTWRFTIQFDLMIIFEN